MKRDTKPRKLPPCTHNTFCGNPGLITFTAEKVTELLHARRVQARTLRTVASGDRRACTRLARAIRHEVSGDYSKSVDDEFRCIVRRAAVELLRGVEG